MFQVWLWVAVLALIVHTNEGYISHRCNPRSPCPKDYCCLKSQIYGLPHAKSYFCVRSGDESKGVCAQHFNFCEHNGDCPNNEVCTGANIVKWGRCQPEGVCQDDWAYSKDTDSCYRFFGRMNRGYRVEKAMSNCAELGAQLATAKSKAETVILRELMHSNEYIWLGMTDAVEEGEWVWNDGERVEWTNWNTRRQGHYDGLPKYLFREPDNGVGGTNMEEDCAIMYDSGFWFDETCDRANDLKKWKHGWMRTFTNATWEHDYVCKRPSVMVLN